MRKPRKATPEKTCENCGAAFVPKAHADKAKWCSSRCGQIAFARRSGVQPRRPAVVDGQKRCNACGVSKPIGEFSPRHSRNGAPMSRCKPCVADQGRAYGNSAAGRTRRYLAKYGVTVEWYDETLRKQDGKCAICLQEPGSRLHVDHCHETGRVRGLLCFTCNSAIGKLGDDVERLRRAIKYLTS